TRRSSDLGTAFSLCVAANFSRQYHESMNLGFSEMIFIFLLALIIFGPKKLPEIGRQIGRALNEFKRASNEFRSQIEAEISQLEVDTPRQTILPPATPPIGAIAVGSRRAESENGSELTAAPKAPDACNRDGSATHWATRRIHARYELPRPPRGTAQAADLFHHCRHGRILRLLEIRRLHLWVHATADYGRPTQQRHAGETGLSEPHRTFQPLLEGCIPGRH